MSENSKLLCLLDVLGFENILKSIGLERLHKKYEELIQYVKSQQGGLNIVPTSGGHVAVGWLLLENTYFSDTILFWTNYNKMSLPGFTQLISESICFGIELKLPLRGTMVIGDMILDNENKKYLGEGLVEAARTERLQNWIGVSFGQSFNKSDYKSGFHLNTVLPYKSHYKDKDSGYATGMVVDWPRRWRETRNTDINTLVLNLDNDSKFSEYYQNTLRFIDFSVNNHDWFKNSNHLDYG